MKSEEHLDISGSAASRNIKDSIDKASMFAVTESQHFQVKTEPIESYNPHERMIGEDNSGPSQIISSLKSEVSPPVFKQQNIFSIKLTSSIKKEVSPEPSICNGQVDSYDLKPTVTLFKDIKPVVYTVAREAVLDGNETNNSQEMAPTSEIFPVLKTDDGERMTINGTFSEMLRNCIVLVEPLKIEEMGKAEGCCKKRKKCSGDQHCETNNLNSYENERDSKSESCSEEENGQANRLTANERKDTREKRFHTFKESGKGFSRSRAVRQHEPTDADNMSVNYEIYENTLNDLDQKKNHERTRFSDKPHVCMICEKAFKRRWTLKKHEKLHFKCKICDKGLFGLLRLKQHEQKHLNDKPFNYEISGKGFTDRYSLEEHGMKSKVGRPRPVECGTCGKGFYNTYQLNRHLDAKTKYNSECKICGKTFCNSWSLKVHYSIHRTDNMAFKCLICAKDCVNASNLKRHVITHYEMTLKGDRPKTCKVCGKKFGTKQALKSHYITHTGVRPFKCKTCGKGLAELRSLIEHELGHTGVKPYSCNICNKKFNHLSNIKRHIPSHIREEPYRCNICNKRFRKGYNLKRHLRIHTGETPFKCEICCRGFSVVGNLRRHVFLHTNERPYECKVCFRTFKRLDDMKEHEFTHTGRKLFRCEICDKSFITKRWMMTHLKKHNLKTTKLS